MALEFPPKYGSETLPPALPHRRPTASNATIELACVCIDVHCMQGLACGFRRCLPQGAWISSWVARDSPSTTPSLLTTAAPVSSQLLSMPRMSLGLLLPGLLLRAAWQGGWGKIEHERVPCNAAKARCSRQLVVWVGGGGGVMECRCAAGSVCVGREGGSACSGGL